MGVTSTSFKKGMKKVPGSGRKPGVLSKKRVVKIKQFVEESGIDVAKYIWETIQQIDDPATKVKNLLEFYKFIDAPLREPVVETNPEQTEEQTELEQISNEDLLKLVQE